MLADLHVKLLVIMPAVHYNVCPCPQSHGGRFEVRGRHGKSVLTISGVRLSDLGRFDCEALSRIGGHQKSMFLDIERKYHKRSVMFSPRVFSILTASAWEGCQRSRLYRKSNKKNISTFLQSSPAHSEHVFACNTLGSISLLVEGFAFVFHKHEKNLNL